MKIGLIKETKIPVDNRVALSPAQMAELQKNHPEDQFVVQASDIRSYTDDEYREAGLNVVDDLRDCDILFGIKEANIDTLLSDKHYIFFGHIAKMQEYNRPLIQALMEKRITFTDYEYLVDDHNQRVCAFGWWAGVVGSYYTLRGYGLKHHLYELPKPDKRFTLEALKSALHNIELPKIKILVTGNGRVSQGAQYVLDQINATRMSEDEFMKTECVDHISYTVADADRLVKRTDGKDFSWTDFSQNPKAYESDFMRWAKCADVLICGHFWAPAAPVYLNTENLKSADMRIRFIGDVTCDIQGSIKSPLRSSTHNEPYYDYNPISEKEEPAFSSISNISVMAVDTCPNALAMDTSAYFGDMLMKHVIPGLLSGNHSDVIKRGTILENGRLTSRFAYLKSFAEGN